KALKLDTVLNMNNLMKDISRQEAAVVLIRLYSVKVGVNPDTVKPKSNAAIKDASQIDSKCYKSVLMTLDLKLMQLPQGGYFKPKGNIGRGELVACFTKVLQLTGEL
ncbi:MAG TPA: S-layer homology domain-containing protein, partial [Clostridia bacterium]|nr:S-layer homology domain-containing protein [Clostridia bacterium]